MWKTLGVLLLLFWARDGRGQTTCCPDCDRRYAEDFVPLKLSERLAYAENNVLGPASFLTLGVRAGVTQAMDRPHEWGQGAVGFGRRYGSAFAGLVIEQSLEQSAALILQEDSRYFVSGKRRVGERIAYALSSALLARRDDGSRRIAYSAIGGVAAGSFIIRAWQPRSTTSAGDAATAFGVTMAFRAGMNVAREFTPHFIQKLIR